MKITMLAAMAVLAGATAGAVSPAGPAAERKVTVCMDKGDRQAVVSQVETAQAVASKMFARIDVKLEWHSDRHTCQTPGEQVIVVSLSSDTPRNLLPGALAYALPYEGTHIEVFYDRLLSADDHLRPHVLAHVFVHEITHILQGADRHSESGIMKAHWDNSDYMQMDTKPLAFTEGDVKMIHSGLKARLSHRAESTLASLHPSPSAAAQ